MEKIVFECKVKRKEKEALTKIFNWCIEQLHNIDRYDQGSNATAKINALEDKITEMVEVLPKLKYMKLCLPFREGKFYSKTIADYAAEKHMFKLLAEYCSSRAVLMKEEKWGWNFLEDLAIIIDSELENYTSEDKNIVCEIILNSLKDEKVLKNKGKNDQTIGMHYVSYLKNNPELRPVVELYINNPETATMQDANGNNIGMLCARCNQQELFELAYKNPVARRQRNNKGETMALIANNNGILVPPLTEEDLYEEYSFIYEEMLKTLCK